MKRRLPRGTTSVVIAIILLLSVFSAPVPAQSQKPDESAAGIGHHERMLEQRAAQAERVRTVVQKTAGEIAEVERQLGQERDPAVRKHLQMRLENLRLLMLRRTILQRRAELRQQELAEHLDILKKERERGTPLLPEQSSRKRRDALTRRLQSAEGLMQLIMEYQRSAVTAREKARVSRLIEDQKRVIADIRQTLVKLDGEEKKRRQQ